MKRKLRSSNKSSSQEINIKNIEFARFNPSQLSRLETIEALVGLQQIKSAVDVAFEKINGDWRGTRNIYLKCHTRVR